MQDDTPENQSSSAGAGPTEKPSQADSRGNSVERAKLLAHELIEYGKYFLQAQKDLAMAKLKAIGLYAAVGILGLIAAGLVVGVSVTLVLTGLAMALGEAMGGRLWAGFLVVGGGVTGLIGLAVVIAFFKVGGILKKGTVKHYEQLKTEQRKRFGRDVEEAANRNGDAK